MREVKKHNHTGLWLEALSTKFEQNGKPWSTQADFDRMLHDFQVPHPLKDALYFSNMESQRDCRITRLRYSQEG